VQARRSRPMPPAPVVAGLSAAAPRVKCRSLSPLGVRVLGGLDGLEFHPSPKLKSALAICWLRWSMADPKKYRDEAGRLRQEAVGMKDPDRQRRILELAALCDRLADHIEKLREPVFRTAS
jgi:hypothetical protein